MVPDNMDPIAKQIVQGAAREYRLDVDSLFKPWPRTPLQDAARANALARLRNVRLGPPTNRYRYAISQLMAWFDCSRPTVAHTARKSADYAPRGKS